MKKKSRTFDLKRKDCVDLVCQFNDREDFITSFRSAYDFIRAYHGTNINAQEQDEILKNGMVVSDENFIRQKAVSRFVRPDDSEELQQRILEEIDKNFDADVFVQKMIFLSHLKQELINVSRQYLLWGPESLLILADTLKLIFGIDFRQRMIDYGEHCIISVNVPISCVSDDDIGEIYEYVVNYSIECCLVCRIALSADNIVGIEKHPQPVGF